MAFAHCELLRVIGLCADMLPDYGAHIRGADCSAVWLVDERDRLKVSAQPTMRAMTWSHCVNAEASHYATRPASALQVHQYCSRPQHTFVSQWSRECSTNLRFKLACAIEAALAWQLICRHFSKTTGGSSTSSSYYQHTAGCSLLTHTKYLLRFQVAAPIGKHLNFRLNHRVYSQYVRHYVTVVSVRREVFGVADITQPSSPLIDLVSAFGELLFVVERCGVPLHFGQLL
ncbi:hypothetical protein Efla_007502 [Eimeria flavescens]